MGVWGDTLGSVYVAQYAAPGYIRKIAAGVITAVAGNAMTAYGGNGAATSIALSVPWGLSGDSVGNLYLAEYSGNRVRQIQTATGYMRGFFGSYTCK